MKFETPIGIGEIVERNIYKGDELINSEFLKVVAISFDADRTPFYYCEYPSTGHVRVYKESEINGDPDFNQETGVYLDEDGNVI